MRPGALRCARAEMFGPQSAAVQKEQWKLLILLHGCMQTQSAGRGGESAWSVRTRQKEKSPTFVRGRLEEE